MPTIIKNGAELDSLLEKIAHQALENTREKIGNALQAAIERYYDEYDPDWYRRTNAFLNSLVKTDIIKKGNALSCEVKIDEDYLRSFYKSEDGYPGEDKGVRARGIDIVNWANRKFPDDPEPGGNHGYTIDGGYLYGFWDGTLNELGDILDIIKDELQKVGINIV